MKKKLNSVHSYMAIQIADVFIYILSFMTAFAINTFFQRYIEKYYENSEKAYIIYIFILIILAIVLSSWLLKLKKEQESKVEKIQNSKEEDMNKFIDKLISKFEERRLFF